MTNPQLIGSGNSVFLHDSSYVPHSAHSSWRQCHIRHIVATLRHSVVPHSAHCCHIPPQRHCLPSMWPTVCFLRATKTLPAKPDGDAHFCVPHSAHCCHIPKGLCHIPPHELR